jgi:hypothetical protein
MPSSTSHRASHERGRLAALWAGILTGPITWLVLLETNYVSSYVACETRQTWFMHAAVAAAVALVAVAGVAAWSASIGPPADATTVAEPVSDETCVQRVRWMSIAGTATSVFFILVILAMEIPILVLRTCQ